MPHKPLSADERPETPAFGMKKTGNSSGSPGAELLSQKSDAYWVAAVTLIVGKKMQVLTELTVSQSSAAPG